MSRFADLIAKGLERIREVAGETVTYRRGAQSVSVTAVTGRSEYSTVDETGMPVANQSRDFLVPTDGFELGGSPVEPKVGDVIEEQDGQTHFVTALGDGQPWQWSDAARTTMRIHTKERGVA